MTAIGGPIETISLSGREFRVAADTDAGRKLGGCENEIMPNGDGVTGRLIKTPVTWAVTGINVEIDDDRGDQEFLQDLANQKDFFPIAITYPSAGTYQGRGQLTGELSASSASAVAAISLGGVGVLSKQ